MTGVYLFLGQSAVNGQSADTGPDLLFQPADSFHKELIKVGADNSQEKDPFQQWITVILAFVQNPFVKGKPCQFPVEIKFRRLQINNPFSSWSRDYFGAILSLWRRFYVHDVSVVWWLIFAGFFEKSIG
jgi:hypothetical protein